jgi:levansucrase
MTNGMDGLADNDAVNPAAQMPWRTSAWASTHVAAISAAQMPEVPVITAANAIPVLPDLDLWDMWPLQYRDGQTAVVAGGTLWMTLSAPRLEDPILRHGVARIRALHQVDGNWRDLGNLLPDDHGPGSREWSGSAVLDPESSTITLFFTAAGRRDDAVTSAEQRLFQTSACLVVTPNGPEIGAWSTATESVSSDGVTYVRVGKAEPTPGKIKAFRDPFWFRDPADQRGYLLFTGSLGGSSSDYNGAIGLAEAKDGLGRTGFDLRPPLIQAEGVNNELERPHMLCRSGRYYLFWSTQSSVFSPEGPNGPTGLYGMVGPSMLGPFVPLNGTGLVLANPASEPTQAYSWMVLGNLDVISFVDHWSLRGRSLSDSPELLRSNFGGTPAPTVQIMLDGGRTRIVESTA